MLHTQEVDGSSPLVSTKTPEILISGVFSYMQGQAGLWMAGGATLLPVGNGDDIGGNRMPEGSIMLHQDHGGGGTAGSDSRSGYGSRHRCSSEARPRHTGAPVQWT